MSTPLILPPDTASLTPQQKGWLTLAHVKADLFTKLQNSELVVQGFLNNLPDDLTKVQEAIKQAKTEADKSKSQRLEFTNTIDEKLIKPAMEFEKRNYTLIKSAETKELALRTAAAETHKEVATIEVEKRNFKAHVENEYFRIAAEYRLQLSNEINRMYIAALEQDMPVTGVEKYVTELKASLRTIELSPFNKFKKNLMTDKDAEAIFKSVNRYDKEADLNAALAEVDTTFALYAQDLNDKEQSITAAKQAQAGKEQLTAHAIQQEVAINTTVASATVVQADAPVVKKNVQIVEENTPEWMLTVIGAFLKNFTAVKGNIKVKTAANLTVGQMAAALSTLPPINGLQYKETLK